MIAFPQKLRRPTKVRAAARLLWVALPLVACGGRSQDPHAATAGSTVGESGGTGAGAGSSSAENGGTGTSAGGSTGGSGLGAGTGGQSAAGAAGAPQKTRTFCWAWSDLENQPKAGESGPAACPKFTELMFVVKETCGYKVPNPAPIPPDSPGDGDCCYGVTDFNCR